MTGDPVSRFESRLLPADVALNVCSVPPTTHHTVLRLTFTYNPVDNKRQSHACTLATKGSRMRST